MLLALTVLCLSQAAFPKAHETLNIVTWEGGELPRVYERSDQLPLTDEELGKLSRAGFDTPQLVKLIEERRCACDASADGLIKLKAAGLSKEALAAVSLHALKPNRELDLLVTFDFVGESTEVKQGTLYLFIDDGPITRVFSAPLGELLQKKRRYDTMVDKSDLMVARTVRRIQLAGRVPLKAPGPHQVLAVTSANPALTHPSQLVATEKAKAKTFTFDYPRASLQRLCRLIVGYKRDALLPDKWAHVDSRFECEWN